MQAVSSYVLKPKILFKIQSHIINCIQDRNLQNLLLINFSIPRTRQMRPALLLLFLVALFVPSIHGQDPTNQTFASAESTSLAGSGGNNTESNSSGQEASNSVSSNGQTHINASETNSSQLLNSSNTNDTNSTEGNGSSVNNPNGMNTSGNASAGGSGNVTDTGSSGASNNSAGTENGVSGASNNETVLSNNTDNAGTSNNTASTEGQTSGGTPSNNNQTATNSSTNGDTSNADTDSTSNSESNDSDDTDDNSSGTEGDEHTQPEIISDEDEGTSITITPVNQINPKNSSNAGIYFIVVTLSLVITVVGYFVIKHIIKKRQEAKAQEPKKTPEFTLEFSELV